MARQEGLEPPAYCLEGSCSILLSYWRICIPPRTGRGDLPPVLKSLVILPFFRTFVKGSFLNCREYAERGLACFAQSAAAFESAEDPAHDEDRRDGEDELGEKLRVGEAVEGEEAVEDDKRGYLECYLAQHGEDKAARAQSDGLEETDAHEVDAHERLREGEPDEEAAAVGDDVRVLHEQAYEGGGEDTVERRYEEHYGERGGEGAPDGRGPGGRVSSGPGGPDGRGPSGPPSGTAPRCGCRGCRAG